MSSGTRAAATIDDLYKVDGKAELIDGRIVRFMPTGRKPGRVAFQIAIRLNEYAGRTGRGEVYADNVGYTVHELASGRRSFSPDASYFLGPFPENEMRFLEGPPTFAVEVRSERDSGKVAEAELAAKRADYFEAGTLAVWDVDPVAEVVRLYQADAPTQAIEFSSSDVAHAEPAVPGWRIALIDIFKPTQREPSP
ncbi:MAG: Uma2 family endonuclease [Planctomycetota bacterium]|nr:Uma2 family endonuclease [Planctomycetaceae bacterium]MDQ3330550.1 Uma2 family endonuclease [Planctomycetota bacterium]